MHKWLKINLLCLAFFFLAEFSSAQWHATGGPFDGYVSVLFTDSSYMYAGTNHTGIYISRDSGYSWTFVYGGLNAVNAIVKQGNLLFAGAFNGVFVSANHGFTWTARNNGLSNTLIRSMAASGPCLVAGTDSGVFISTNNGMNWSASNSSFINKRIRTLFANDTTLYASTWNGVYVSVNHGSSWNYSGLGQNDVLGFAAMGNSVFAATRRGPYVSLNGGASWTLINNAPDTLLVSVMVQGNDIFFGSEDSGLFHTPDTGITWDARNNGILELHTYAMGSIGNIVFATTKNGLYRSVNNGQKWDGCARGFGNRYISALCSIGDSLIGFTGGDHALTICTSADSGDSWRVSNSLSNSDCETASMQGSWIFATASTGGYLSIDSGRHFNSITPVPTFYAPLYGATRNGRLLAAESTTGLYVSDDTGHSWNPVTVGSITSLWSDSTRIVAGTSGGWRCSMDNGNTWSPAPGPSLTHCIFIQDRVFIAGFINGLAVSTDSGGTYAYQHPGMPSDEVTAIAMADGNIFAATRSHGIYLSKDSARSWIAVTLNLPTQNILALQLKNQKLYAGLGSYGVYYVELNDLYRSAVDSVWPGDCNYDGIVNNTDFLYLGLAWNDTGAVRPGASISWTGQPVPNWENSFAGGINHKHADTDGDGTVMASDSLAIIQNYALSHPLQPLHNSLAGGYPLTIVPDHSPVFPGDTVTFDIRIASASAPVDSLYGIAFSLLFDANRVDTSTITFTAVNSSFGNPALNMRLFSKSFLSTGQVDIALTRINHINASHVQGTLARVSMVTRSNSPGIFQLTPSAPFAITSDELSVPFYGVADSVLIMGLDEIVSSEPPNLYPVPTSSQVYIKNSREPISKIQVYDMKGRLMHSSMPGKTDFSIRVSDWPEGSYLATLFSEKKVWHRLFIVSR